VASNERKDGDRRITGLWAMLILWCLTFFNAARFIKIIPVWAFAVGAVINFVLIATLVIALRNAYRHRRPPGTRD
jgi:hypothetical protein